MVRRTSAHRGTRVPTKRVNHHPCSLPACLPSTRSLALRALRWINNGIKSFLWGLRRMTVDGGVSNLLETESLLYGWRSYHARQLLKMGSRPSLTKLFVFHFQFPSNSSYNMFACCLVRVLLTLMNTPVYLAAASLFWQLLYGRYHALKIFIWTYLRLRTPSPQGDSHVSGLFVYVSPGFQCVASLSASLYFTSSYLKSFFGFDEVW